MLARFISIDICCAPGHVFPRSNNKFEKTLRFFDCTGQERTTSAGTTAAATTTESGGTTTTLPPIIITTNAPDDCPPADGCAEDKPNMDCPASKVPRIERGPDPTSSILYDRCCSQIVCEDETTTTTEPPQTTTVVTSTTTSPVPTTTASPDPPPDPFDPHVDPFWKLGKGVHPLAAVMGPSKNLMAAPRLQQFVGIESFSHLGNAPLKVRPYAGDHPSPYQAAPVWPPAPPEPVFPLNHAAFLRFNKGDPRRYFDDSWV